MKAYFITLLDYDRHTNFKLLQLMQVAGYPQKAVTLFSHLLFTQQIWLKRCKGESPIVNPWPVWEADVLQRTIEENYRLLHNYLEVITDPDLEMVVSYKNSKGESFKNKVIDILAHVFNHGTHHRAQIGQLLKQAGIEQLPFTDYIFYIRENQL
jgi:uncharacterized damage-inducible protein DinB